MLSPRTHSVEDAELSPGFNEIISLKHPSRCLVFFSVGTALAPLCCQTKAGSQEDAELLKQIPLEHDPMDGGLMQCPAC